MWVFMVKFCVLGSMERIEIYLFGEFDFKNKVLIDFMFWKCLYIGLQIKIYSCVYIGWKR